MDLYHYTDLNAVHSILDTHKIRMTDIRFLNDRTEYRRGLQILEEASHEVFNQNRRYSKEIAETVEEWFPKVFKELADIEYADEMFYVASFSKSSDTLSQWRSYGMFAIALDTDKLLNRINSLISELRRVEKKHLKVDFLECYYINDESIAIQKAIDLIFAKAMIIMDNWWQADGPPDRNQHLYKDLKEIISMLATTFKHISFSEEEEMRLVISDKIVSQKINFRVKNNVLIPFYELNLSPDVFTGVKIGPVENQKLSEQSLDIYNSHRTAKLGGDKFQLVIETSEIPYRTL
ncbi:DUF2971 domain-containing protein [Rahnella aquatilis]|uniref:DUF2971 domain-containing protein n=1 Tax=Rahnella aquatilis TaxID=34038 RepID=UPI0036602974